MHDAKRKNTLIAATLLLTVLFAGLIWQANLTQVTAPAPDRQKITIATASTYLGSGLLYLAQNQGYFAQQGLDVTLAPYTSGRDALNAHDLEPLRKLAHGADGRLRHRETQLRRESCSAQHP